MANNPISSVIVPSNPNIEGVGSGMEGGASDSVIGICTDEINPSLSSFARVIVGARSSPIGMGQPALGAAAFYVDYDGDSFDRSPVIFAEADTDAAIGEIFATTLNFSVTNESSREIKIGEWLWGVAVPQDPLFFTMVPPLTVAATWRTNGSGVCAPDGDNYIRFDSNGRITCFTGARDGLLIGARYRVQIDIGDLSGGTIRVRFRKGTSPYGDQHIVFILPNTSGADNAFEFVASDDRWSVDVEIGSTAWVQMGVMQIYGPLAT